MNIGKLKRYIRRINNPSFSIKSEKFKKRTATFVARYENSEEFKKILQRNERRASLKVLRDAEYRRHIESPEYQEKYVWTRKTPRK